MQGGEKMKKLGKKLHLVVETIESYSCTNCASGCTCSSCFCSVSLYADNKASNYNQGIINRTQAPTVL